MSITGITENMSSKRKLLGLIGYPLTHSFSQRYFSEKFIKLGINNLEYQNFEMENISGLPLLVKNNENLIGFNVTIPFKEAVLSFLDEIESEATSIGAVNVVKIVRHKGSTRLTGYNTDRIGVGNTLNQWDLPSDIKAIVFGTGGSSKAVIHELARRSIPYLQISRHSSPATISYHELKSSMIQEHKLLINCTPVGMYPHVENRLPVAFGELTSGHFMFDLIYNPDITGFLKEGLLHGAKIQNGLLMLHEQAEASWRIWTQ